MILTENPTYFEKTLVLMTQFIHYKSDTYGFRIEHGPPTRVACV
jgi:hypothetical protein